MDNQCVTDHVRRNASEFLDGHIIIGFNAETGELVFTTEAKDAKTAMALNAQLVELVTNGGVSANVLKKAKRSSH